MAEPDETDTPDESVGSGSDPGTDPGSDPAFESASPLDSVARKFQKELNSGLIALVLLSVLERAEGDMYGYQIAKQLQSAAPDANVVKQGALYPVLRNMSASGLLASRVVPSYSGPPRRYYRITDEGRAVLRQWLAIWGQTRGFVELFTQPAARATGAD